MFNFEKIIAYQKAIGVSISIYQVTEKWPNSEKFSLTDQLHRATTSIALNIAEGSSRSAKDFCHFLDIARGSCFECVAILSIAKNQKYISDITYQKLYTKFEELIKIIQAFKKSIRNTNT